MNAADSDQNAANLARPDHRPNKKQRRQLSRFRDINHFGSDEEGF